MFSGVTFQKLTSASNEAVVLAGLHGSFTTGNVKDDDLEHLLARVARFEVVVRKQREEKFSAKDDYNFKTQRKLLFSSQHWNIYDPGSEQLKQSRSTSGRFGGEGESGKCFLR